MADFYQEETKPEPRKQQNATKCKSKLKHKFEPKPEPKSEPEQIMCPVCCSCNCDLKCLRRQYEEMRTFLANSKAEPDPSCPPCPPRVKAPRIKQRDCDGIKIISKPCDKCLKLESKNTCAKKTKIKTK